MMWILLPSVCLALAHIAGDNVAVVPDMALILGKEIYLVTLLAYIVFGSIIAGLTAWIGVKTGHELVIVVRKLFGCRGKKISAFIILSICIPASILTGGFYSGWITNHFFGISLNFTIPLCILLFSLLAAGYAHELLKLSNYISLLLVPAILAIFVLYDLTPPTGIFESGQVNWFLVLALVGYNAGGMRSALIVETAAHLSRKGCKAIILVMMAKVVEGLFTLGIVHLILLAGIHGPLAVSNIASKVAGPIGFYLFNIILFCTFMSAMVPAMTVNARQLRILTGLSFKNSLIIAGFIVYLGSLLSFTTIIEILAFGGIVTIIFIVYTAYTLHKYGLNQS
jgi:hypothetical protein